MTRPFVSVLVDTYNHEKFIEQAVTSVLEQDFPAADREIIVVDDGSTDRTPDLLAKFAPAVRVLRKANGGQASAFNAGIPECRGEFIAFLDGDDWWAPNKLSRALDTFAKEPDLGFVGHGDILVFPDGRQQVHVLRESVRFRANTLEGALLFRVRGAFLGTCRMTVRASVLRQILPIPEALTIQADEYLFTLAAALCNVRILPEPLFYYRFHDANAFQIMSGDPQRLRRKQKVLAVLARSLEEQLRERGIEAPAVRAITERVQADADQLRLMLDGGWPWETVKTEWNIYEVMCPDAPLSHRVFKRLSLLAALVVSPKFYYSARQRIAQSDFYLGVRKRWLPIPEMTHIHKNWRTGS
jgi:glycosyltransferase involved in cell wall biosynthesis